jgi:N-acetylglucosamine-6-phosphate deacetylase
MILYAKLIENDQIVTLHIDGENISRIEPFTDRSGVEKVDPDLYVAPGLFDPQVNGFAGVDFNGKDLMPDDVHRAAQAVSATGSRPFSPPLSLLPLRDYSTN